MRPLSIHDRLLFLPASVRVALLLAGIVIVGLAIMTAIGGIDPMNAHGRGPGWECEHTRGAAATCAKDAKPPISPRKPRTDHT